MPRPLLLEGYCPRTGRGHPVTLQRPGLASEYPGQAAGEATVHSGQTCGSFQILPSLTRVAF